MKYEMMVGLEVTDDDLYSQYRAAMMPILQRYGGGFRYDFRVSEVLKNAEGRPINRVFAIYCDSKASMDAFFADEGYLQAKQEFFAPSVGETTIISQYEIAI
ncbi:DUF1330 domain-containing protein [Paremcibacter congregatus]|uniref:DUF1330 domain-containing protein n=1 Tax=Paremcibacter congregatus TaxID=2043170 RepID=A0A2G4YP80_9PROT|nr:DUF1330 domain-containing protein [Paremcibacter congregatus]PHZ84124.1 DUF1330 domain-containing protein [Paremcibacter congregatus]QDE25816.1 DUF1330 domain-containing protein [Paremcibacter congregatus]